MLNPLIIGLITFAVIQAGAVTGWAIRQRLPKHHLTDETKGLVSVSMAVVATVSALVLGLLISNANTSFSALAGEVTTLSAQILRLDQMLRRYGRDTDPARETLRQYAERKTSDLFPDDPADVSLGNPSTYELLQRLEDSLLDLKPANPRDQWWLGQAMTLAAKIGDTRWLLAQQVGQGTPKSVRRSPGLLADLTVRQFWSVRAAQRYISGHPDAMRTSCSRCRWNDPRTGAGVRRTHPYLAATDAPGRRGVGSPINRRRIAVRQLVLRREFCPIHYPPQSVQGPLSEARLNAHPYTPPVELLRADWILPQLRMLRFDLRSTNPVISTPIDHYDNGRGRHNLGFVLKTPQDFGRLC